MYPKKRWASNITAVNTTVTVPAGQSGGYTNVTICTNAAQNATPTPVLVKFGRVKVSGDVRFKDNSFSLYSSCILYCMFVPQGAILNSDLIENHPEYLLGWTTISMDSGSTFTLTSSLKRNLNSGDSIQLYFGVNLNGNVLGNQPLLYNFFYNVQYWTTSA